MPYKGKSNIKEKKKKTEIAIDKTEKESSKKKRYANKELEKEDMK